jgi:ParB family chromosome partitioning protein
MSTSVKSGLGKGFESLIPTDFDSSIVDGSERIKQIAIDQIIANPDQPRHNFDTNALEELASSIKRYGILQPLVLTKKGTGYEIIAGERRWRASKIAGKKTVPAIIRSHEELEKLEVAIIENVQRVDLSPLEQARSIHKLHDQFSMSYADIAGRLGKAPTTVNNIVRLIALPEEAKEALEKNKISEGHARSILALKGDDELQKQLLDSIIKYGWSVRQAEQFVLGSKRGNKTKSKIQRQMATQTDETKKLSDRLKTKVTIRRSANGGKIELHFTDDKDLKRIVSSLDS